MSYALVRENRLGYREGRWLLLAVALHLLLLTIPGSNDEPGRVIEPARLAIRLMSVVAPARPEPSTVPVPEPPRAQPMPAPPRTAPAPPTPAPASIPAPELASDPPKIDPAVSAARLIGMRDSVSARVPLPERSSVPNLKLGSPGALEQPGNWRPGTGAEALAPFENWFNGKTAPSDVEVVDRWLAADGSHNVIVETPAGLRLCGRAQAWDPARPLIESIMMWQVCGGDSVKPFKYTPRKPLNRDFIVPMAKEATEP